ncbi:MAG: metal-dependent hydrolase [Aquificae bacterium]|nr:metal-dependent hydrolase [Aquificota bacterium]
MKGATHALGGLVFAYLFGVPDYAVPAAVVGALFPDVDLKFSRLVPSKGSKKTLWNTHRGFTHHPLAVLILFLLWAYLEGAYPEYGFYWDFLYGFWVGYLSHLALDALTKLGIPVGTGYYPRFGLRLMKTGGLGEKVFAVLLAVAFLGLLYLKGKGIL